MPFGENAWPSRLSLDHSYSSFKTQLECNLFDVLADYPKAEFLVLSSVPSQDPLQPSGPLCCICLLGLLPHYAVTAALRSKNHMVALLSTEQVTKMALTQGWLNEWAFEHYAPKSFIGSAQDPKGRLIRQWLDMVYMLHPQQFTWLVTASVLASNTKPAGSGCLTKGWWARPWQSLGPGYRFGSHKLQARAGKVLLSTPLLISHVLASQGVAQQNTEHCFVRLKTEIASITGEKWRAAPDSGSSGFANDELDDFGHIV